MMSRNREKLADPSRRRLLRGEVKAVKPLRLPWTISESVFTEKCTQCHLCIEACETKIITQDKEGFPTIDFETGECTFCTACHEVCEQPLFFHRLSSGKYRFKPWSFELAITDLCLAKHDVFCQSCMDVCGVDAIHFGFGSVENRRRISQPEMMADDCTQCGACITTCPQTAIVMRMN